MSTTRTCPSCHHLLPSPAAKCPSCGTALAERPADGAKKRKKKKKPTASRTRVPYKLIIGAAILGLVLLSGSCLLLIFMFSRKGGGLGGLGGGYAVVDEMPEWPPAPEPALPPDSPAPPRKSRGTYSAKVDPTAQPVDYASAVGAVSPEQSYMLAALGGPYAVGVPVQSDPAKRIKQVKTDDPARPFKSVPLGDAPYPVVDIRTNKEIGAFPAAAKLQRNARLSSDGQFAITRVLESVPGQTDSEKEFIVVWKRGSDKPVMRWELKAPVNWAEFIGPD